MKTKESIKAYNKEYFARPAVIARAKIRNAKYRARRKDYKKTLAGKRAERKYKTSTRGKAVAMFNRIKNRYGLSIEGFESLIAIQKGVCAICGAEPNGRLHIDHCHTTGKVRGLLCVKCNLAIGLMNDNTALLLKAIQYLQR